MNSDILLTKRISHVSFFSFFKNCFDCGTFPRFKPTGCRKMSGHRSLPMTVLFPIGLSQCALCTLHADRMMLLSPAPCSPAYMPVSQGCFHVCTERAPLFFHVVAEYSIDWMPQTHLIFKLVVIGKWKSC